MLTKAARPPPIAAWKGVLPRRARSRQAVGVPFPRRRTMATEAIPAASTAIAAEAPLPPPLLPKPHMYSRKPRTANTPVRSVFAIYPRVPSSRDAVPAALEAYHAQQIRRLDPKGVRGQLFSKKNPDSAKPGDVLQVTTRRGEPFAGVCLAVKRAGVDTAILLRNHLTKIGVEVWYKIYSPNIVGIEIVWRRPKRARRAKLLYMRQPKHDMGNVDHLVAAWRRARNVFSSKGKGKGQQGPGIKGVGGTSGGRGGKSGKR